MSRSKYKIYDNNYAYFITTSVNYGLPVFSNSEAVNVLLENLLFLKEKRDVKLIAYIIMENHLHVVLWGDELGEKFGKFKSYSARKIIDLFEQNGHTLWLERMKNLKQNFKKDRNYQLWEESFHPKQIFNDEMMIQKIEYIHNNPVKRGYVDKPEHWRNSSVRNYRGLESQIPINKYEGWGRIVD